MPVIQSVDAAPRDLPTKEPNIALKGRWSLRSGRYEMDWTHLSKQSRGLTRGRAWGMMEAPCALATRRHG